MALQDETHEVMEGIRELALLYSMVIERNTDSAQKSLAKIRELEENVEQLRRRLTLELADIGAMIMAREDALRAAYSIEQITANISGIGFRILQLRPKILKRYVFGNGIKELIDMSVEMIHRLDELVRTFTMSSESTLNLANDVQRIEREIDDKYRILIVNALKEVKSINDLILLKDIIEGIETLSDVCLEAVDSITILALGF